ncbi:MAG: ArsC/Spx/MgsR family protein [Pseudomonadota bacterium]
MFTLFGIKSCDTCRKARQAAERAGKTVTFHDVRETPLTTTQLERFFGAFGDALVNRKSTTWRGLSEADRARSAIDLLTEHPTLMKRPVIEVEGDTLTLGWSPEVQKAHLG